MSYTIGDLIEAQLGKKLPKEESITPTIQI